MKKKQAALKDLKERRMQEREEKRETDEKKERGEKTTRTTKQAERIKKAQKTYDGMKLLGLTPKEAMIELSKLPGDEKVPTATWRGWKAEGLVCE
jgi:hypothetical protein